MFNIPVCQSWTGHGHMPGAHHCSCTAGRGTARLVGVERLLAHSMGQQQKCPLLKGIVGSPPPTGKRVPSLFRNWKAFALMLRSQFHSGDTCCCESCKVFHVSVSSLGTWNLFSKKQVWGLFWSMENDALPSIGRATLTVSCSHVYKSHSYALLNKNIRRIISWLHPLQICV